MIEGINEEVIKGCPTALEDYCLLVQSNWEFSIKASSIKRWKIKCQIFRV